MWHVTLLLLAVAAWCGLELARGQQMLKSPFLAVVGGSAVVLLFPAFVTRIEAARLIILLYVVLLVWAIARAAPYRRALAGVSMLLVWVNFGTLLAVLLWGL
jgi:hypothetical protein